MEEKGTPKGKGKAGIEHKDDGKFGGYKGDALGESQGGGYQGRMLDLTHGVGMLIESRWHRRGRCSLPKKWRSI